MSSVLNDLEQTQKQAVPYDQTLRAIGQVLEPLGVQDFDLETYGNNYVVRGDREARREGGKSNLKKILQTALDRLGGRSPVPSMPYQFPSAFPGLELRFTPEDIERLERQGRGARHPDSQGAPNFQSQSQILRLIGAYISRKSGRLVKISKRKDRVAVEFDTALGQSDVSYFSVSELYDFWVHLYLQRKSQ